MIYENCKYIWTDILSTTGYSAMESIGGLARNLSMKEYCFVKM